MRPSLAWLFLPSLILGACSSDALPPDAASIDKGSLLDADDLAAGGDQSLGGCGDGQQDGDETDVDCGGTCSGCDDTRRCNTDADCLHHTCIQGTCRPGPLCTDGSRNGDESDVDCGGSCDGCDLTRMCRVNKDCASHLCRGNQCMRLSARPLAFAPAVSYPAEGAPRGIAAADFDGDGVQDLAVGLGGKASIGLLLGVGGGTFKDMVPYQSGGVPWNIVAGDFNKDGTPDLAVPDNGGNVIVLLARNGAFPTHDAYPMPDGTYRLGTGDLDGDGDLDIAAGRSGGASWLPNKGNGKFDAAQTIGPGFTFGIASGDLNGDGITDVIFGNMAGLSFVPGSARGMLASTWTSAATGGTPGLAVFDLDGDGKLDFAAVTGNSGVIPFLGDGKGTFRNGPAVPATIYTAMGVVHADFNGDGWDDLAYADDNKANVVVVLGDGRGSFTTSTPFRAGMSCYGITTADFNKDGRPDLAVTVRNPDPDAVMVLLNRSQ